MDPEDDSDIIEELIEPLQLLWVSRHTSTQNLHTQCKELRSPKLMLKKLLKH